MKRPGVIKQLSNLSIDEVSLVDRGGNQFSDVLISKRLEDEVAKGSPDQSSVHVPGNDKGSKKGKGKKAALHGQNTRPSEDNSQAPPDSQFTSGAPDGEVEEFEDDDTDFQDPGLYKALVEKVMEEAEIDQEEAEAVIKNMMPGMFPQQQQYPPPPGQVTPFAAQPMGMGAPAPGPQNFPAGGGMPQAFPSAPGQMPGQMQSGPPLPPEVVQYIKSLEAQLAQLQGADKPQAVDQQKNATSQGEDKVNPFGKNLDTDLSGEELAFLEELSKSLDDEDTAEAVSKAMEAVSKAEERAQQAEEIAKAERDIRLNAEYVAKARTLNLSVNPEEFGPVLKRMAEALEPDDFEVITKVLTSASAALERDNGLFGEVGKMGGGANASIFDEVTAKAQEIAKSKEGVSKEAATAEVFESNPALYDEYLRNNRR